MIRLQNVLKMSSKRICETSWRPIGKTFCRCYEDVLKTSWRRLEDVWARQIYWSWPRRLEDVFWRRMIKKDIFVFRRRLKPSSRRLDQDKYVCVSLTSSEDVLVKTNIFVLVICLQDVIKTSCQDVFKTFSRRLAKTSSWHLQDVFKTSSRRLQDVLP